MHGHFKAIFPFVLFVKPSETDCKRRSGERYNSGVGDLMEAMELMQKSTIRFLSLFAISCIKHLIDSGFIYRKTMIPNTVLIQYKSISGWENTRWIGLPRAQTGALLKQCGIIITENRTKKVVNIQRRASRSLDIYS